MKDAPSAPDPKLKVDEKGIALVDDLRELLRDLGSRVGISSGHDPKAQKEQVKQNKGDTKTLQYFQFEKSTGWAKNQELRRIHALLLRAVPEGNKSPFRARKSTGVAKRSDLHAFHRHWLKVFQNQKEKESA